MFLKIGRTIIFTVLWAATVGAQDMAAPVGVQFPLFLKILTFDRNLKTRVGQEIVIGILYQRKFRVSLNAKDELIRVVNEFPVKEIDGLPVRCVAIDIGEKVDLTGVLSSNNVDILYVTPLRAVGIETITAVSRARQILTITGVPEYAESGLAVGIGIKGERPLIIVNLPAARAEGANFASHLLKLSKVLS
jgi:hypothetical protein